MTRLFVAVAAALLLAPLLSGFITGGDLHPDVIYGDDGRHELYEESDAGLVNLADSTVALFQEKALARQPDGSYRVQGRTFQDEFKLCNDEPFKDQTSGAFCSGFLVAPDTVVTAGHCVKDALECSHVSFGFGFNYSKAGAVPERLASSDVYRCKSIIHREQDAKGADFAVVQLDRKVVGHDPVPLRKQGSIDVGDALTVIGYPSGIPLKISSEAVVRDASASGYFVANTDTYGGNSGSPVVSTSGKWVEGILVRGEVDFMTTPDGCLKSYRCDYDKCRGEDITKISAVLPYLPAAAPLARNTAAE